MKRLSNKFWFRQKVDGRWEDFDRGALAGCFGGRRPSIGEYLMEYTDIGIRRWEVVRVMNFYSEGPEIILSGAYIDLRLVDHPERHDQPFDDEGQ